MKNVKVLLLASGSALLICHLLVASSEFPPSGRIIDSQYHHLGRETMSDWPEAPAKPEGTRFDVAFTMKTNAGEWTFAIRQRDVTERCMLMLNGKDLALLKHNKEPGLFFYPIPSGALKEGENLLRVVSKPGDSMVIGPIHLYEKRVNELIGLRPVTLTVSDAITGMPVPARITVTDLKGKLVEIFDAASSHTAVRLGTLYTLGTETQFKLTDGEYIFYATHGMEWSRGEMKLSVSEKKPAKIALTIRREVDTTGFIAADTHIHTLTFSGHGDSSVEERMITLAGEGVELAVATDHNHNTDYLPYQKKLGMHEFFTSVTGNEISSSVGHINGFPLDPKASPPNQKLYDWVQLVDGIRAKGAKVVILNHPRGEIHTRYSFNVFHLNRASGEFAKAKTFPFDAMELTNPSGKFDPLFLLGDWFALLNYGNKVTAVCASDSHTVGDAVGWWRSYVPSATDDPAKIDVDDACNRYVAGETSVAMGIFTDVRVDGSHKMGETYSPKKNTVDVRLRVAAPSWVKPRRALVFLNGQQVAEKMIPESKNSPTDLWLDFSVPLPKHDAYLVCAIVGDGVNYAIAGTKSEKNVAFTWAVTNPIYLDNDGDGEYKSPREIAGKLLSSTGKTLDEQWKKIISTDEVIAVQMVSLLRDQTAVESRPALDKLIREAMWQRPLFAEYAQYALPMEKTETSGGR